MGSPAPRDGWVGAENKVLRSSRWHALAQVRRQPFFTGFVGNWHALAQEADLGSLCTLSPHFRPGGN